MKRVGILTCSESINFGTVLQAMSLQKIVQRFNYETEIIDYRVYKKHKVYSPLAHTSIRSIVGSTLFFFARRSKYLAFEKFKSGNMKFSSKVFYPGDDFQELKDTYDIILVGSDQVWNPFKDMSITLLDFYNDGPKKVSYASSFGVKQLPESVKERYSKALSQFAHLSTREEQGKQILNELGIKKVVVALDPTLLMSHDEWLSYATSYNYCDHYGDYILLYMVTHSANLLSFCRMLSRQTGLKVLILSDRFYFGNNIHNVLGASPADFLRLCDGASYIVTNSFHGVAFSINFKKHFFVECPLITANINNRIENLLELTNLQNQLINSTKKANFTTIDYEFAGKKLAAEREKSLQYIKRALAE